MDDGGNPEPGCQRLLEADVWQAGVAALADPQDPRRFGRLGGPLRRRAPAAHFAGRQVEDRGAVASFRHAEQALSAGLLDVVVMGRDR